MREYRNTKETWMVRLGLSAMDLFVLNLLPVFYTTYYGRLVQAFTVGEKILKLVFWKTQYTIYVELKICPMPYAL